MIKGLIITIGIILLADSIAFGGDQLVNRAKEVGFKRCLPSLSKLEKFFTEDVDYGSWSISATENANSQVFNASLELTFNQTSQIIDLTVAPMPDGSCSAVYTRTLYSDKNCIATSKEDYMKEAVYKSELNKRVTMFQSGAAKVLLLPTGSGCLIQKKEVLIRFDNS